MCLCKVLSAMERIISSVIPSLVKEGIFGDVELKEIWPDNGKDIGAQYGSTLAFVNMKVKSNAREVILPLLIKTLLPERKEDGTIQFMMESLMYKKILPNLCNNKQVFYPKLYYSSVSLENPEENVIIFENVKYKDYRNSSCRIYLDFNHISLALKTIAKFHSLSLILKHEQPRKFFELTENIKKYSPNQETYSDYNKATYAAIERGIRRFEKEHGTEKVLENVLKALENPSLARYQLSLPEEPFDVICHGDFCNNNVMYKYNDTGSPTDCILYDFQLSMYGNIAVEIAFFLYLHTDSDSREKYWDSFLKVYWDTLREAVPEYIELPTFPDFLEYFGTKAVIGYIICSYFLPMMIDPSVKTWAHLSVEEQVSLMKTIAGEEGEKAIADIFSHMYKKKYVYNFLKFMRIKCT